MKNIDPAKLDRFRGCLVGLAVGDAVGTATEWKPYKSFKPITDMVGGGPFNLEPGYWSDDTSMSLCLASSLVEFKEFDPRDQMERYCRWWKEGYLSSTGSCFDIGMTIAGALTRFEQSGNPFEGPTAPDTAGNGSLMRLAPVPMYFVASPAKAIDFSAESSRTTHGTATAVDACRYFAGILVGALSGASKADILAESYRPDRKWRAGELHPQIQEIAAGSFKLRQPPEIRGGGFVVETIEAALWAFYNTKNFRECILAAANLGHDADTTGAISGQVAGAFYGHSGIPKEWLTKLQQCEMIETLANKLCVLSEKKPSR
jgi:ADP-ribosylglycohydrolase